MIRNIRLEVQTMDGMLKQFSNQLAAVGEGKARVAMARALNYGGRKAAVQVKRDLVRQTSIPRAIVNATVKTKAAAHKGSTALEFVIYGRGSELPLNIFKPRQFRFGVRAKVWGKMQKFPGMFGAPGDNPKVVSALHGHIFHRTGKSRLPIEKGYGPSIPKEMVIGQTAERFQKEAAKDVEKRLRHELGRMLS